MLRRRRQSLGWWGTLAVALVGCREPDDRGWRAHPCPEDERGATPPFVPLVDGLVDEWIEDEVSADDPAGDASAAFDITRVAATSRGSELYVKLDIDRVQNLYAGRPDDGTLVLELRLPDGRRLSVDFRARRAVLGSGAVVPWQSLGLVTAPSHAARTFEVRFDMSAFEARPGSLVEIDFGGSDALVEPLVLPLRYAAVEPVLVDDARAPGTVVRVASLNTLQAGLFDPARDKPIARLLRAAAADVYCLQELGFTTSEAVVEAVEAADPRGDGARWHAHAAGAGSILGNAVVATHPVVPIPLETQRAIGAVVLSSPPVAVLSVHLKCCGYHGSEEDALRLAQVRTIRDQIVKFRLAELGDELAPYRDAPLIVAGDFNHVGSPDLVGDLVSERSLGLRRWMLPHLAARDVFTWHGYESDFPPATLDLLLYHRLEPLAGFVLDSAVLPEERLLALGLWGADSSASDHLMLVADFR